MIILYCVILVGLTVYLSDLFGMSATNILVFWNGVLLMRGSTTLGLGYIEQGGYPCLAPQFKYINENEAAFAANERDRGNLEAILNDFKALCSTTPNENIIFIMDDRIEPNHPILAMFKGKLFAGINNESDKPLLFDLKESCKTTTPTPTDLANSKTTISYVTSHQSLPFSLDEHFRIIGKMILNCLAMHFSQETALHATFNDFREYVRFGSNASQFSYVSIIPKFSGHSIYENLSSGLKLTENSHLLLCGNVNQANNVFGIVSLYNGGFEYAIRLQTTYGSLFDSIPLRMLHVEYETKKEYEIIKTIIAESDKLHEDMFRTS